MYNKFVRGYIKMKKGSKATRKRQLARYTRPRIKSIRGTQAKKEKFLK